MCCCWVKESDEVWNILEKEALVDSSFWFFIDTFVEANLKKKKKGFVCRIFLDVARYGSRNDGLKELGERRERKLV